MPQPAVIATWPFGRIAVRDALPLLQKGRPALDAAIAGAGAVEDDPSVDSVGYAGLPNAVGTVQLDSCVMDGRTLGCGAVAALENIRHPAAVAKRVMERTPHILLVGAGAQRFALQQGFDLENLLTPESLANWQKRRQAQRRQERPGGKEKRGQRDGGDIRDGVRQESKKARPPAHAAIDTPLLDTHDTVTVLALDQKGNLGGVCTTSGLANKVPGRVGDSPIIGAGLYVDNSAGAAGATGVGEEVIRIAGSFFVVERMRAGRTPQQACEDAITRINQTAARRGLHPARVAFLALDVKGRTGAACTQRTNFQYAVSRGNKAQLLKAREIGGN